MKRRDECTVMTLRSFFLVLKFSIRSSTHYLPFLRRLISILDKLVPDLKCDHQVKMSCAFALVEAVNNVIFHAHKNDPDKWIDLMVGWQGNRIEMEVHDNGPGFDLPEISVPPVDHVHGRGLFIINSLMGEVEYKRGRSNILRMVYYL